MNKKSVFSTGKKLVFDMHDPFPPWDRKIINSFKKQMANIAAHVGPDKWEETFIHQLEILVNVGSILRYSLDLETDGKNGGGVVSLLMDEKTWVVLDFNITPTQD